MNRTRLLTGLTVAVVLGLLAARFVYQKLQSASAAKPAPTSQVVVAAARIPIGQRLDRSKVRMASWPAGQLPVGSFGKVEDCVDRAVISPLVENEPILEDYLAPKEGGAGLTVMIPEGQRALSVRVDDVVAVAGFVGPGAMVDVLVTGDVPGGNNTITRVILEDIRVLAAGQKVEQDREGKPQTVTVVTLQLTPAQANILTLASTEGKIHLALRNTVDTKEVNPPPAYKTALFAGGPPPVVQAAGKGKRVAPPPPPPKPPDVYVIEVIRGDKRDSQTFPESH
jgi:pilus assembly protein CpaB